MFLCPLLSGVLLGLDQNDNGEVLTRDINNSAENWFKSLKHDFGFKQAESLHIL